MSSRIMTWFGVPVPPWKEKKLKPGASTLRFLITGSIPSLKNNKQATTVRKDAYDFIDDWNPGKEMVTLAEARAMARGAIKKTRAKVIPNHAYQEFLLLNKPKIEEQAAWWSKKLGSKGLIFPLSRAVVNIRFYWSMAHIQDTMNKAQSVLDLLTASKILTNDDYTVTDPKPESGLYKDEIIANICMIQVSINL